MEGRSKKGRRPRPKPGADSSDIAAPRSGLGRFALCKSTIANPAALCRIHPLERDDASSKRHPAL
jgi:hypothetical protein